MLWSMDLFVYFTKYGWTMLVTGTLTLNWFLLYNIWYNSWPCFLPAESWSEQFMYILFWGTASVVSLAVIYIYGSEFVDQPKLVHTHARVNGAVMYDTPKTAWECVCLYTASFHMTELFLNSMERRKIWFAFNIAL